MHLITKRSKHTRHYQRALSDPKREGPSAATGSPQGRQGGGRARSRELLGGVHDRAVPLLGGPARRLDREDEIRKGSSALLRARQAGSLTAAPGTPSASLVHVD